MLRRSLSTEALARGSARRPWLTLGIWAMALIAAGAVIVTLLQGVFTTEFTFTNKPEAQRGEELLQERLRGPRQINEIVIVNSTDLTVDDPAFQQFTEGVYKDTVSLGPGVIQGGVNYYQTRDPSLVSPDRHTTILPLVMAGTQDQAQDNIPQVLDVVNRANGQQGFRVLIAGDASISNDFQKVAEDDLRVGETVGVTAALVILVLVFGALASAVVPILLAIFSIALALGATALIGQLFQFSFFVTNMVTMMGLAVGIDYSLFIISRYREERRRGLAKNDAIAMVGATASRTVFFSGMAVVLALLGLFILPVSVFRSMAAGAIFVVIAAVAAALTLLPAVISLLGDKVNALRIPLLTRRAGETADPRSRFWDWIIGAVMKRPLVSLIATIALLVAAAVPAFDLNPGFAGVSTLPDNLQSKKAFLILRNEFSFGLISPAEVVIDGQINSPPVHDGIQSLQDILGSDSAFGPARVQVNATGDLALFSVPVQGDPNSQEAHQAVKRLRKNYIPQAFSGVDAQVLVTGVTAFNTDFFELVAHYTPIVFAFVLGLSFVLLTIVFRSIVVPIKAILMNLLSVGAAYGLIVLVTQKGFGAGVLGFQQVPTVDAWIPLFLFSVLFGLSMDYHVFLLSRIRERYDQSQDNTEAVAFGIRSTAGIITGAALIMVAVFAGFASGNMVMFQQVGFGLGVAVLLDATIVRSVLVPSAMRLLGSANWYLPKALRWLPDLRVEAEKKEQAVAGGSQK